MRLRLARMKSAAVEYARLRADLRYNRGMRHLIFISMILAALALSACAAENTPEPESSDPWDDGANPFANGKADGWDWINDPERFSRFLDEALEYRLSELPTSGAVTKKAWPETYWPTFEDSTNARWLGADTWSPLEKYDFVYNGWVPPQGFDELRPLTAETCSDGSFDPAYYEALGPAARWQSENRGHWRSHDGVDSDGDGEIDECSDWDGIDGWWGLCHAWTPAAILEDEPTYPVVVNDITFYPSDLKALMITIYDYSRAVVIGGRCKAQQVERDENGRIVDPNCRDTNAGAFHVIMSNFLGRYSMGFAEDRTYNDQVWNQPVDSYTVDRVEEISESEAMALLVDGGGETYTFNEEASRWAEVEVSLNYVTESYPSQEPLLASHSDYLREDRYNYVLEMDEEGRIIGGEWIQAGANGPLGGFSNQPDFLWMPIGPASNPTATPNGTPDPRRNPHLSYSKVTKLFEQAQFEPFE